MIPRYDAILGKLRERDITNLSGLSGSFAVSGNYVNRGGDTMTGSLYVQNDIIATGSITGFNLSGLNTGNVTVATDGGLTFSGTIMDQVLTMGTPLTISHLTSNQLIAAGHEHQVSGLVPYSGAIMDVNLGSYNIKTTGSISAGSIIAQTISGTNVYASRLSGSLATAFQPSGTYQISGAYAVSGNYVPYVGANSDVNIGTYNLITTGSITAVSFSGTNFVGGTGSFANVYANNISGTTISATIGSLNNLVVSNSAGLGASILSNVKLNIDGTQTSSNNAFALYMGNLVLTPANTWNAYFQYAGGGYVDTGSGNTIANAYGFFNGAIRKTGTGSITNTYGIYITPSTSATNNYGGYIGGNLGLGITNPSAVLSLGTTVSDDVLKLYQGGTNNDYGFGIGANNLKVLTSSAGAITFNQRAGATVTERMRVHTNGNVGIGTNAPSSILHLAADTPLPRIALTNGSNYGAWYFYEGANLRAGLQYIGTNFSTAERQGDLELFSAAGKDITFAPGNAGNKIEFKANGDVYHQSGTAIRFIEATTGNLLYTLGKDTSNNINTYCSANWDWYDASANHRMRLVSSNGYLGIGSGTPDALLTTYASGPGARTTNARFHNIGTGVDTAASISFSFSNVNNDDAWISAPYNGSISKVDLAFGVGGNAGATPGYENMRLTGNGNLGIGNNNPTYKLQVNGSAIIHSDLDVQGENKGQRVCFTFGKTSGGAGSHFCGYAAMSFNGSLGIVMPRPGCVVGVTGHYTVTSPKVDGYIEMEVRKNNVVDFVGSLYSSGTTVSAGYGTRARNAAGSFIAGDFLNVMTTYPTFSGTVGAESQMVEVVFDT